MKKKILLVISILLLEFFALSRWMNCWKLHDEFYFTKDTLTNTLLSATHSDVGVPLLVTRALHNKVFAFLWGVTQTYLQYWDIRFLGELLGVIGGVGVLLSLWYLVTQRRKSIWLWMVVGLGSICIFTELLGILHFPFFYRLIPLTAVLQLLSLFGIWQFLQAGNTRIRWGVVVVLLGISFLALWLEPQAFTNFCLKI